MPQLLRRRIRVPILFSPISRDLLTFQKDGVFLTAEAKEPVFSHIYRFPLRKSQPNFLLMPVPATTSPFRVNLTSPPSLRLCYEVHAIRNATRLYSTHCSVCRYAAKESPIARSCRMLKKRQSGSLPSPGDGRSDCTPPVESLTDSRNRSLSGTSKEGDENPSPSSSGTEEKPVKAFRRQKTTTTPEGASPAGFSANPDLLTIPGVGPRNFRKLVHNGFEEVAQLKQLYRDKFYDGESSSQKMVKFLQTSVGIVHRNHASSITAFIKRSVDEERGDRAAPTPDRITFCVEGNISVGKTTFLKRVADETLYLRDLVEVVPEPIDKWQDVGPGHFNILDAFYAEPRRYAYTFQNYVFVTRVMQERESSGGVKPLRLMERSVFSDRMVFVRAVHEAKWMNEMEISIYDSWFDPVVSCLPGLVPDGFIYLRASPDTCHRRMMLRRRAAEGRVSVDYLRDLHDKHDSWFFPLDTRRHGVLSVSGPAPPDVFYLEGNHMHPSIRRVPALVLDCEANVDFNTDTEAKAKYACQVANFFEFVKKNKENPTGSSAVPRVPSHHLWLPHSNPWPTRPCVDRHG